MPSTPRDDPRRAARRLYELLSQFENRHLEAPQVTALRDWLCTSGDVTEGGAFDGIVERLKRCTHESRLEGYERNAIMLMCSRVMNDSRAATDGAVG